MIKNLSVLKKLAFFSLLVGCTNSNGFYEEQYPYAVSNREVIRLGIGVIMGEKSRERYTCLDHRRKMYWEIKAGMSIGECLTGEEMSFKLLGARFPFN